MLILLTLSHHSFQSSSLLAACQHGFQCPHQADVDKSLMYENDKTIQT